MATLYSQGSKLVPKDIKNLDAIALVVSSQIQPIPIKLDTQPIQVVRIRNLRFVESIIRDRKPLKISENKAKKNDVVRIISFPGCMKLEIKISRVLESLDHTNFMMLDVYVVKGSSGGALLNDKNELIGIVTSGTKQNNKSFFECALFFRDLAHYR